MFKRYPHEGKIVINTEIDNGTSIPSSTDIEISIKGRFEPSTSRSKNIDYSGVWFCEKFNFKGAYVPGDDVQYLGDNNGNLITDGNGKGIPVSGLEDLADENGNLKAKIEGKSFVCNDTSYKIVNAFSYQTYCEIWLE